VTANYASVYLISGGVNYYLSGTSKSKYTGSGTPWTAENTSPYSLSNNPNSPIWVAQPADPQNVLSGVSPFSFGSRLLYRSYDLKQEQVGIQMYANSFDNAVALLRQLRQILNTAIYSSPCVLAIVGKTNTVYYEIVSASVPEQPDYLQEGSSTNVMFRATITWLRSPFGALLSAGETLINAQTFTTAGSTVTLPSNVVTLGSGKGDLIYEGQPLNIKVTPSTSSSNIGQIWAASIYSQTKATSNSNLTTTAPYVGATFTPTGVQTNNALKLRVIARVTSGSGSTTYGLIMRGAQSSNYGPLYQISGVSPTTASTGLVDFGPIPVDVVRNISPLTGSLSFDFYVNATTGTPNLISAEWILYYDFCKLLPPATDSVTQASGDYAYLNTFREITNLVALPNLTPTMSHMTSGNVLQTPWQVVGTPPRFWSGASLWLQFTDSTGNNTTTGTRAATVTATHGPLYGTLRGAT
jgi:hypothetical protein